MYMYMYLLLLKIINFVKVLSKFQGGGNAPPLVPHKYSPGSLMAISSTV